MTSRLAVFITAVLAANLGQSATAQSDARKVEVPGTVHTVLQQDGTLKFMFVPDAPLAVVPPSGTKPPIAVTPKFPDWLVDPNAFKTNKASAYKVQSDQGKFAGYWFGADTPESAFALQNAVSPGWSVEKVANFNPVAIAYPPTAIPLSREQVTASLQRELFDQAKQIACKSKIRPKEIKVAATLQASAGVILVGTGSITFELTWETAQLCR